jgi:hypothetical protein
MIAPPPGRLAPAVCGAGPGTAAGSAAAAARSRARHERRVRTARKHRDRVTAPRPEGQERNGAARVGAAAPQREGHFRAEVPQRLREDRGGARVQSVRKGHAQRRARLGAGRGRGLRSRCDGPQRHERLAHAHGAWPPAFDDPEAVRVGDDHRCYDALRRPCQPLEVEADERLACAHPLPGCNLGPEAVALQRDCVDPDVQQDVGAVGRADRDRVRRLRQRRDFAFAGRAQHRIGRIDGEAVAEHPGREHFVVHLVERPSPACQGRQQHELAHGVIRQARPTGSPRSGRSPGARSEGTGLQPAAGAECGSAPGSTPPGRRPRCPAG